MSDPNYNRDQLINSNFEAIRHLRADHDDQKARLDKLVETMNTFREQAMTMLTEMAAANKLKGSTDGK